MLPPNILAPQTPISHITLKSAIDISKSPPNPPKKHDPNTDAHNAAENDAGYSLNAADDAAYTKLIQLSL